MAVDYDETVLFESYPSPDNINGDDELNNVRTPYKIWLSVPTLWGPRHL